MEAKGELAHTNASVLDGRNMLIISIARETINRSVRYMFALCRLRKYVTNREARRIAKPSSSLD